MFNRYIINKNGPDTIIVKENRAPTDESIKLLDEMQQKAFEKVMFCVKVDNNQLHDIVWYIYPDKYSYDYMAGFKFMLNGREISGKFKLPSKFDYRSEVPGKIYNEVLKEISKQVCYKLFEESVEILKEVYD